MASCIIVDAETKEQKTTRAALVGAVEKQQQPPPPPSNRAAPPSLGASLCSLYKTRIRATLLLLVFFRTEPAQLRPWVPKPCQCGCHWHGVGGFMFNSASSSSPAFPHNPPRLRRVPPLLFNCFLNQLLNKRNPTNHKTPRPTAAPTPRPTAKPTAVPAPAPTPTPTPRPTFVPTTPAPTAKGEYTFCSEPSGLTQDDSEYPDIDYTYGMSCSSSDDDSDCLMMIGSSATTLSGFLYDEDSANYEDTTVSALPAL